MPRAQRTYPTHGFHAHHARHSRLHERAHATQGLVPRPQALQAPHQLTPQVLCMAHSHHGRVAAQPPVVQRLAQSGLHSVQSLLASIQLGLRDRVARHKNQSTWHKRFRSPGDGRRRPTCNCPHHASTCVATRRGRRALHAPAACGSFHTPCSPPAPTRPSHAHAGVRECRARTFVGSCA